MGLTFLGPKTIIKKIIKKVDISERKEETTWYCHLLSTNEVQNIKLVLAVKIILANGKKET